jgi:uncharacterized membrane protein
MPFLYESYAKAFARVKDTEATVSLIITAPPAYPFSIQVLDAITKKPVANATVQVDTKVYTTGSDGTLALDIPEGSYTVKISHPSYLTKTLTVAVPMAETQKITLIPLWAVGLGIVGGVSILTIIIAKAVK